MDTGLVNSLVYDYLSSVGPKMAEKFKKETKAEALPSGSPTIQKMVEHFKETTPAKKRKLEMTNGSAKKSKKDDSSSDDDSEDEEKSVPAKKAPAKTAPVEKMEESSSDDSSDDEEDAKPKKVATPAKPAVKATTPAKPVAAKKEESSSDDSDSEDEKPAGDKSVKQAAAAAKKESSSEEDSSDDEEEVKKPVVAPAKATPAKKEEESSSDDSSEDEEEVKKPVVAPAKATPAKKEDSSSDEDSSDDEEEKPVKKAEPKAKAKKEESSDDSSDDSDEEEEEPIKKVQASTEDDSGMKMVNNKGKKEEDFKTPTKNNQSFGGGDSEEGRKIFIHNVGESSVYEDFQEKVEKFGEITDFFNPGRGFAFITYSTSAEAQACIAAMDNTEIAGKTIQMNIARPKGSAPAPGTGGKSRPEAPMGCKLFVHGVTQETANADLQAAFEEYGTVTDAYNPGKGFAFVTFSKAAEATAAMEALEGQEVCGNTINVSVAKPKGGGDTPRGGGRGGRGGGGGGGRRNDQEGCKLFVHNVSEETSQDDLWNAFAEHGTVTDAYNPGRGFAFITYGSPAEAKTAMEALEGQEVCGRTIQCNIAKPKGEKSDGAGGGRGGRGGRGGGRGGGGRGGRGGRGGMQISATGGGGQNKKMSFD